MNLLQNRVCWLVAGIMLATVVFFSVVAGKVVWDQAKAFPGDVWYIAALVVGLGVTTVLRRWASREEQRGRHQSITERSDI